MLAVPVQIPYCHHAQTQGTPKSDSAIFLGAGPRTLLKIPPEFSSLLAGHHHTPAVVRDDLESPHTEVMDPQGPNYCVAVSIPLMSFWRPFTQIGQRENPVPGIDLN